MERPASPPVVRCPEFRSRLPHPALAHFARLGWACCSSLNEATWVPLVALLLSPETTRANATLPALFEPANHHRSSASPSTPEAPSPIVSGWNADGCAC